MDFTNCFILFMGIMNKFVSFIVVKSWVNDCVVFFEKRCGVVFFIALLVG